MTRILVVDDADFVRVLIREIIAQHDDDWTIVSEARDGYEAVKLARDEQPDVVLLDVSMPIMDGMEALPRIRRAAPNAVIVVLTGFPARVGRESALGVGADAYLEKDELVTQLVPRLQAILGR
jgi:DNA-binding NarL/FixJ family response regulator